MFSKKGFFVISFIVSVVSLVVIYYAGAIGFALKYWGPDSTLALLYSCIFFVVRSVSPVMLWIVDNFSTGYIVFFGWIGLLSVSIQTILTYFLLVSVKVLFKGCRRAPSIKVFTCLWFIVLFLTSYYSLHILSRTTIGSIALSYISEQERHLRNVVEKTDDIYYCSYFEEVRGKNWCITSVAVALRDALLCHEISSLEYRTNCEEKVRKIIRRVEELRLEKEHSESRLEKMREHNEFFESKLREKNRTDP